MDRFFAACDAFGRMFSPRKAKVTFTLPPGGTYKEPTILLKYIRLKVVGAFPYLGSTISKDGALNAILTTVFKQ